MCFMFELVSQSNTIVVQYTEDNLLFHGCRNLDTLNEESPDFYAKKYNWNLPKYYEFESLEEVVDAAKRLDPLIQEGFVICDSNFNRVKVKNPGYVQIALLRANDSENLNRRRMLTILQLNESEEFLSYFPQFREDYEFVRDAFNEVVDNIENLYDEYKHISDRREFAQHVTKLQGKYQRLLFMKHSGKDIRTILLELPTAKLESIYLFPEYIE
eukprot:TRINITY_DN6814_c0_g1_i3.p1 TRINITY_DN6814_c0_g1~~TRINITY_DN6814_c0_g1_i3.p1  ORF type:complete len:214 (-),score=45.01 TRINITY_DN6814_c0_g1_i3:12-653(-)